MTPDTEQDSPAVTEDDASLGFLALVTGKNEGPGNGASTKVDLGTLLTPDQQVVFERRFVQLGVDVISAQRQNVAAMITALEEKDTQLAERLDEFTARGDGQVVQPVLDFEAPVSPSQATQQERRPRKKTARTNGRSTQNATSSKGSPSKASMVFLQVQLAGKSGISAADITNWAFEDEEFNTDAANIKKIRVRVNATLQQLKKQRKIEGRDGKWFSLVGFRKFKRSDLIPGLAAKPEGRSIRAIKPPNRQARRSGKSNLLPTEGHHGNRNAAINCMHKVGQPMTSGALTDALIRSPEYGYNNKGAGRAAVVSRIGVMLTANEKYFRCVDNSRPKTWVLTEDAKQLLEGEEGDDSDSSAPNALGRASPKTVETTKPDLKIRQRLVNDQKKRPTSEADWEELLLRILDAYSWQLSYEGVFVEALATLGTSAHVLSETVIQNGLSLAVVRLQSRGELEIAKNDLLVKIEALEPVTPVEDFTEVLADDREEEEIPELSVGKSTFASSALQEEETDDRREASTPEDWNEVIMEAINTSDRLLEESDIILLLQRDRGTENWRLLDDVSDDDIDTRVRDSIEDLVYTQAKIQEDEDGHLVKV